MYWFILRHYSILKPHFDTILNEVLLLFCKIDICNTWQICVTKINSVRYCCLQKLINRLWIRKSTDALNGF